MGTFVSVLLKRDLSYGFSLIPALLAVAGNLNGGWWAGLNIVYSLLILAIIELMMGKNTSNSHGRKDAIIPEAILMAQLLLHTVALASLLFGVYSQILTGGFAVLAVISTGVAAGSGGIIVAHELIHKASTFTQLMGKYLLLSCGNYYFYVHHLRIHHRHVGTESDAATAKRNETLYAFFYRTVRGQTKEAWESEKKRLGKIQRRAFHTSNILVGNLVIILVFMLLLLFLGGWMVLFAWLGVVLVSNTLLEYVNYIEHYGLVRNEHEKVDHTHSWNCDKVISRFVLFDLSRHADHHYYASKPYHMLDSHPHSPVMPGGYICMVLPALIPWWWFALVHPRLDSLKNNP
ncbi:MAG: alkane 1-monooxygenase [Bacteroidia bacterium]|nr:alkane 1-monooxygenase [Bacteroidia bacterium]